MPTLTSPKSRFLLKHHKYLLIRACAFFPFTADEVRKYSPIISWCNLAVNRNVEWDVELIEEFKHELFDKDGFFPEFNDNESLPWSLEFVQRFEDLIDWEMVSSVEKVVRQLDIMEYYRAELSPYIDEALVEDDADEARYEPEVIEVIDSMERNLSLMTDIPERCVQTEAEIERLFEPDWLRLSQNTLLDWNAGLMDRYSDKWDWLCLEMNSAVPWDLELIKRYDHLLQWPRPKEDEDGNITTIPTYDLCHNWSIVWTKEMISEFLHKLNPIGMTYSPNVEWSLDVLESFPNLWWYDDLPFNNTCWNRVFPEYNHRKYMFPLLDELLRQEQRILKLDL